MKRVLVAVNGVSAENASFALSRALEKSGCQITYLGSYHNRDRICAQGFTFLGIEEPPFVKEMSDTSSMNFWRKFRTHVHNAFRMRNYIYLSIEKCLDKVKPDLVLLDAKLFDFSAPFLKSKIPIIQLNSNLSCCCHSLMQLPPVFSSIIPVSILGYRRFAGRCKTILAWLQIIISQKIFLSKMFVFSLAGMGFTHFTSARSLVRKYGGLVRHSEYGLRLLAPEIVLGPEVIDFPGRKAALPVHYAGVCVDEKRRECDFDFDFLAGRGTVIYCSMGTNSSAYLHARRFCEVLMAAMKELHSCILVMQTEAFAEVPPGISIPDNVFVFPYVPQLQLLQRATLHITHGGFSSVRESLRYGVPMIVFPGWHDQFGNAARVVFHGVGLRGEMKAITAETMVAMIKNILGNSLVFRQVKLKQKELLESREMDKTVEFVEFYIKQHSVS